LQIGSAVRMQGIKVGKVEDYAILPGEARRVRVILQVDARTPVLEGVVAEVARHLVTGLASVDLVNQVEGGPPLMRVTQGEKYPVIPENVPRLTRMAGTLEEMSEVGRDAMVRFNTLLSDENQEALAGILENLDVLTTDLRQHLPALREEFSATLAGTRQAAARMDNLGADASGVLRDSQVHLDRVARDAETTLASARHTLGAMDQEVHDLTLQLRLSADLASQEIQSTAQALRQAGEALQQSGRAMSDPARILYGVNPAALGPGEQP
jgi:phospholipid/cholesterol/gamma-HCH transport system substrate-binding protein